jgi:6-pyruvoyltetrahydropterin/6-carboxytetrahydropterin synthase
MYYISKRLEVAGAHHLDLPYESKCSKVHGHNWIITVYCRSATLDENGMVIDFGEIKEAVMGSYDHRDLNEVLPSKSYGNPTAERIAKAICDDIGERCWKVEVQESEGNIAIYVREANIV